MNTENIKQNMDIKNAVFEKIESGEVSMRSKNFFLFKVILLIFTVIVALIVSSLLVSYILFSITVGGHINLLGYGAKGIYEFFMVFPWIIFLVDVALLLFIDWQLKSFRFGYNSPVIYLFLGTFMIITIFGSLINFTSFHMGMMRRAEDRRLPVAGSLYSGLRRSHSSYGIYRGTVEAVDGNVITLLHNDDDSDLDDGLIRVVAPAGINLSNMVKVGDDVFVAGDATTSSQIQAYGITRFTISN